MQTRRAFLGLCMAGVIAPLLPAAPLASVRDAPQPPRYGWDPEVAGPTEADVHVAPWGDDGADGGPDAPLATIQAGIDRLSGGAGRRLALRGGLYRERVDLSRLRGTPDAPVVIHRYGRERVTITAAEPLTGWRLASAQERDRHGLPEGTYVAPLDPARLSHGTLQALNLHEGGRRSPIALDRADMRDPTRASDWQTFHEASFALHQKKRIAAIRDPRLKGLDPARLQDARIKLYHAPNVVTTVGIAGFDPASGTIHLSEQSRKLQMREGRPAMRYAIENVAQGLGPGQWMVRRDGGAASVFLRPRDPANLAGGVEITVRDACIEVGDARSVHLMGLEAIRAAGGKRHDGNCLRRSSVQPGARDLRVSDCRFGETDCAAARGYGAVFLRGVEGLWMRNVTVSDVEWAFGFYVTRSQGVDLRELHIHDVSNSAARFFGVSDTVLAFSLFERSGLSAHANKFNFYQGCDRILVYGVRTRQTGGYVAFQKSSRIHFAFCEFDCDPEAQNRALVAQMREPGTGQGGADGSGDPVAGATFYYWNLSLVPARGMKPANALSFGPERTSQSHAVFNSVIHGGGFKTVYRGATPARQEVRSHNRYTGLSFWQSPRTGWRMAEGEARMAANAAPPRAGRDMRPLIRERIAPLFPNFADWDRDALGRPVDWSSPPIGAYAT